MTATLLFALLLSQPCDRGPAARLFDFWVGEWEVRTEDGKRVGESRVTHALEGCAVVERFRGSDGEGTSLSTYSAGRGRWEKLFTNSSGLVLRQEGVPVPGGLRFVGTGHRADGTSGEMRTTFIAQEDGRVRQSLELSDDGGRTWRELGVAIYVPHRVSF